MKSTGYVKQLDNIGRIELPRTLMHELSIDYRTALEIFNDSDSIVLMEHKDHCSICNNPNYLSHDCWYNPGNQQPSASTTQSRGT